MKPPGKPSWHTRLAVFALLAIALALGVMAFFALYEIALTIGAVLIAAGGGGSVRQNYALATLRNVWLIVSGALMIVLVIGGTNYVTRRLDKPGTWRILLAILAVEMLIIGINAVIG